MDTRTFYPYLDNFDELTIIVPLNHYRDNNAYKLVGNDEIIDLKIFQKVNLGSEVKLICSFDAYIDLGKKYCVVNEEEEESELYTGKIVRTELFDNIYNYKRNDLGFTYTDKATKFKIWTPVAKYVHLELVNKKNKTEMHEMLYTNSGVWRLMVDGNLDGYRYHYHIFVNGKEQIVTDPYAVASTPYSEYSVVIDKSKTYKMKNNYHFEGELQDAIIYEMSIRDFSIDPSIPFKHRGKFKSVTQTGLKTKEGNSVGIDYLKELGITHVQIMPFFDFDGVDEFDDHGKYNWGYNPRQFNVPQGWFSTKPDDPYNRINDLKEMIDTLHANGIGVIMDVVYNHVYSPETFPIEKLVPGYMYHVDRQGIYTSVSGCGNDLATHRKMIRKLIVDSTTYWVNEYKIDGYRFDLMGLIDFETMNEIRQELHSISNHILLYGEGWKMYSSNQADRMAHMFNKNVMHTIGFFNDTFRESVKGATFNEKVAGYAFGITDKVDTVKEILLGSAHNRFLFKYANQSINYVECHDNNTFFDKGLFITKDREKIRKAQKLATSMVLLSEGVPFIHAGQEFYRTKQGVENSFESPDEINVLDWSLRDTHKKDIDYFKSLIAFRKKHPLFKLKSNSELSTNTDVVVLASKSLMMTLSNGESIIVIFKPKETPETIVLPMGYELVISSTDHYVKEDDMTYVLQDVSTFVFLKGNV